MTEAIKIPQTLKSELEQISSRSGYVQVLEILSRGGADELVLHDADEAQAVVNVARVTLLDALLRYPYWDDTKDQYDETHEEGFQEIQMGLFEKVVSYVSASFDVETKV